MFWVVKVEMAAIQQQNSELIEGLRPSFWGADRIAAKLSKTKDWALVQNAALVMKIKVLKLGLVRWTNLTQSNLTYSKQT